MASVLFHQAAPNIATADGTVLGTEKIRLKLELSRDSSRFTGTVLVEIRDAGGSVLFSGPGSIEGTRIVVEPLP